MTEAFLHYVWQHQMLSHGLTTTGGQPVCVLRAGEHNRDAGPDFLNARITIGSIEWAGNVEIHIHSSDWNAHNHQHDAAYNNVVLHVVYEDDAPIFLQNGKSIPTLELRHYMHPSLVENYEHLTAPQCNDFVPCQARLKEVPQFTINSMMERLIVERIDTKSDTVRRLLEESRGGWEQTCYWLMARYFGGKVNALPFELLAKNTDQRLLARWRDNRVRLEALLYGQAGLLEGYFEEDYPRLLQADYEAIRTGASLSPIEGHIWRFFCIRPPAFPTIRISQFADLVMQSKSLFSTLLEMTDAREIEHIFCRSASEYWNTHYRFDSPTPRSSSKHIGRAQADLLIINAWVPLLFTYGSLTGQEQYKNQALSLLVQLPPEDNAILRHWAKTGLRAVNAAESQALLHLHNHYCQERRCLECRIGYHLLKHQ